MKTKSACLWLLIISFSLIFAVGFSFYLNGPQRSTDYETVTLYSDTLEVSNRSYVDLPADSIHLFISNATMIAQISASGTVDFHVLNEIQFNNWKDNGNVSDSIISAIVEKPLNLSIAPKEGDHTYYFAVEKTEGTNISANLLVTSQVIF